MCILNCIEQVTKLDLSKYTEVYRQYDYIQLINKIAKENDLKITVNHNYITNSQVTEEYL